MTVSAVSGTVIKPPKPPAKFGQRKVSVAPPNWAVKTPREASSPPRKKSLREMTLVALGAGAEVTAAGRPATPVGSPVPASFRADLRARVSDPTRRSTKRRNNTATTATANVDCDTDITFMILRGQTYCLTSLHPILLQIVGLPGPRPAGSSAV